MADTPPIKISERLTNWETYKKFAVYVVIGIVVLLLIMGGVSIWRFFFPKADKQINNPRVIVTPFAKVEKIDQANTQILLSEKPWEAGAGVGGFQYDNKTGVLLGVWAKRKW